MYLKKIHLENVGPIDKLALDLAFNENGNPKPLILVGENGTGKTNLLSYTFDAIFEFYKQFYKNISKDNSYFRYSGGNNIKEGAEYLLSYLLFEYNSQKIEYIDKNGNINLEKTKETLGTTFENLLNIGNFGKGTFKSITNIKKNDDINNDLENNSYGYFPANRYELPYWFNQDSIEKDSFGMKNFISGILEKDIIFETSLENNKKWLLDIVLDYYHGYGESKNLWDSVNIILRKIIGNSEIRFAIGDRNRFSRISIVKDINQNIESFLPSINCLSLGQSVLLNLFISIIKLSDSSPKLLEEISGIVIIDEIDLHLHSNLQKEILPQLIQLFPKVQFIITTHSPLFLLGMEKTFGADKIEIREMPTGEIITAERFKEFENAFKYLKETKAFENEMQKNISQSQKDVILFVEGESDKIILENAWEKLYSGEIMNFTIINGFDRNFIGNTFARCDIYKKSDKKFIGMLDFDDAYENYQRIKEKDKIYEEIENNEIKGLTLKHKIKKGYLFLLPVPDFRKNYASKSQKSNSNFCIEFLFPDYLIESFLEFKEGSMGVKIPKFIDSKKVYFANSTKNFGVKDFDNFKPLFEKINSIINN